MEVHLRGKKMLVTGGTGALGRSFVTLALKEGAEIYFTYHRNEAAAESLSGLGAKGFRVDLSKRSEIDELKKRIQSETRELDGLVFIAGMVRDRTIQNLTEEEWNEVIEVNLNSVYYAAKKFLSFLFKKPGSRILNLVSRAALRGGFGQANYAAAKAGLIALTKSLAQELGRKQILVNGLNPGFMKSGMTEHLPEWVFERERASSVLGAISDPEAVSEFMAYLMSDRFRGVSGQIFHFDSRKITIE